MTVYRQEHATTTEPSIDRTRRSWQGPHKQPVPPGWRRPDPCAYQFRLRAWTRVTNGVEPFIWGLESRRHVTLG